ncbi:MAG: chorismate dehydratase [Rhodothermaceae bacterium]|nr:MAG: chorismate dehydratase [Rhodothermaceae bacterium]
MRLAIWNEPAAEFLVSALATGAVEAPVEVVRGTRADCERWLRAGAVEVALLPTLNVLRQTDAYDVLPAVALSTWAYPFARLVTKAKLDRPLRTLAVDPRYVQEVLVARIILREHYGNEPRLTPYDNPTLQVLLEAEEDAALLTGTDVPALQTSRYAMDLGQEWYELANYPMVWGLFAVRKGEVDLPFARAVRDVVAAADTHRDLWIRTRETYPELHDFYLEQLRVRLDDLAIASLTNFREYLFFYGVTDEVPGLPLVEIAEDDEPGRKPLL